MVPTFLFPTLIHVIHGKILDSRTSQSTSQFCKFHGHGSWLVCEGALSVVVSEGVAAMVGENRQLVTDEPVEVEK